MSLIPHVRRAGRRRAGSVATAVAAMLLGSGALVAAAPASATPPTSGYSVTVGAKGTWSSPTDSPASPYIDKDGTFYFQQSAADYGANDAREWDFYTGGTFDSATRSSAISDAGTNPDTTTLCNNSPTGKEATYAPSGSGYAQKNYCDLIGTWVDPDTGDWYGLVHNEFTPQPFGDGLHYDAIDYAVSTDQGKDWTIKSHVITSPYSTKRGDTAAFPNQTYYYGDGDQRLYVDAASGYFYVYYGSRVIDKSGGWVAFYEHVARAPISGKMAPGSWQKWYDGSWSQPGAGGKESDIVPVGSGAPNGYVPPSQDYNPANSGTAEQQIAAGKMPSTSPLFVMDITYDAYLGLYIGEPQAVDQSGNAPQQYYATDNLATQKWYPIGDTGSYHTASWYRWFLDSGNKTSSTVVGKSFRSYCSYGCSGGSDSEYVNVTVDNATRAASPFDPAKTYTIANGNGRVLAQNSGASTTTSAASGNGSALQNWQFTANGDGSYRIANASTGQLLGVDSGGTAGRAWGAALSVSAAGPGGPSTGQQWWIITDTDGSYRLVNRYSGLALALSATSGRLSETTPVRTWTDNSGNPVGGGRTAAQQTLTITASGTAPVGLTGTHTLSIGGKALDDPNHSTTTGVQLDTWTTNGGANQNWKFTQNSDGSYQLVNAESGLCADVDGGSTSAGAAVIQWTCTGGTNQHWTLTRQSDGTYTAASVKSGLFLTTASSSDGSPVTQQAPSSSALQHWSLGQQ